MTEIYLKPFHFVYLISESLYRQVCVGAWVRGCVGAWMQSEWVGDPCIIVVIPDKVHYFSSSRRRVFVAKKPTDFQLRYCQVFT